MTAQKTTEHTWADEYGQSGQPTGWLVRDDGWLLNRDVFEQETSAYLAGLPGSPTKETATDAQLAEADAAVLAWADEMIADGSQVRIAEQQGVLVAPLLPGEVVLR